MVLNRGETASVLRIFWAFPRFSPDLRYGTKPAIVTGMACVSVVRSTGLLLSLAPIFLSLSISASAGTTDKTNQAFISYEPTYLTVVNPQRSDVLMERFLQETADGDSVVFDRLSGPPSRLLWNRAEATLGYESIERFNANGAAIFTTIALDSLRNAAVEVLPLDLWENYWGRWLGNLLVGTI